MGSIIHFPIAPGLRRRNAVAVSGGAEILFFTGVRYERHQEPVARRARSRRPLRKKRSA
jgi:hypothetical protein